MQLKDLPVGSLVKDPGTIYLSDCPVFRILEHGHSGDPEGSTTLEFRDIICLKSFDAKEPENSDEYRQSYGNNRYLYSNLLQWLNSDGAASSWYMAQHSVDQSPNSANVWQYNDETAINPYDTEAGFMTFLSAKLKAALISVSKTTVKSTIDGDGSEEVLSKIFLLSTTEVGLANENSIAEGSLYSYYSTDAQNRRKKNLANAAAAGNYSDASSSWYWWLRTPLFYSSNNARIVFKKYGTLGSNDTFNGNIGVSPAFCIPSTIFVSDIPDSDGVYSLIFIDPFNHYYIGDENNKAVEYKPQIIATLDNNDVQFKVDESGNYCYKKQDDENFYPLNVITSSVDLGAGSPLPTGSLLVVYNE